MILVDIPCIHCQYIMYVMGLYTTVPMHHIDTMHIILCKCLNNGSVHTVAVHCVMYHAFLSAKDDPYVKSGALTVEELPESTYKGTIDGEACVCWFGKQVPGRMC